MSYTPTKFKVQMVPGLGVQNTFRTVVVIDLMTFHILYINWCTLNIERLSFPHGYDTFSVLIASTGHINPLEFYTDAML